MRDARNQLTHRCHFFGLQQLRLNLPLAGDVVVHFQPAHPRTFPVNHRTGEPFQHPPHRPQHFQFVVCRLLIAGHESLPALPKSRRRLKPRGYQLFQFKHGFQHFQPAVFHSEVLPEARI